MAYQLSTVRIINQSQVAPPPGTVSTTKIPLTFFDMAWLFCCPVQRVIFYDFPCSTLHFTQTLLPQLKQSLYLTLRYFYPFAANLICPPPPNQHYILYNEGDGVTLTATETNADFNLLVSNRPRAVKTLKSLVPDLPSTSISPDTTIEVPTMAIQLTLFPNSGVSIGFAFNHMTCDGRSFNHFLKFWASTHICVSKSEDLVISLPLPYHNKGIIRDPKGLLSIYLNDYRHLWQNNNYNSSSVDDASNNVLITVILEQEKIQKLKDRVVTVIADTGDIRVTTFVVVCAFMWVNLIKLQEQFDGPADDDDAFCHMISSADCRERFGLSIPASYFGNCLMYFLASCKRRDLIGENGMVVAAKALGSEISSLSKDVMAKADKFAIDTHKAVSSGRVVAVAGSPNFKLYETDFGWGKPKKTEMVHIGTFGAFSLHESGNEEGGVQIGLVVNPDKLDRFNAVFNPLDI